MKISILSNQSSNANTTKAYPKLESVTSPTVDTEHCSYYLNRKPQTLRIWACRENGPLRPKRIFGRLAWSVVEIKKLLGVGNG